MSVRLTHKYADTVDGVDLSHMSVGDHVRLRSREAALLIAEGWAVPSGDRVDVERRPPSATHQRKAAVAFVTDTQHGGSASVMTTRRHENRPATASWPGGHNPPLYRAIQLPTEQTKI